MSGAIPCKAEPTPKLQVPLASRDLALPALGRSLFPGPAHALVFQGTVDDPMFALTAAVRPAYNVLPGVRLDSSSPALVLVVVWHFRSIHMPGGGGRLAGSIPQVTQV